MALKIEIISAGANDKQILPLLESYLKNMQKYANVTWTLVASGNKDQENKLINNKLIKGQYIVLDETGDFVTTHEIAKCLDRAMTFDGGKITFVLGGPYGLSDDIIKNAKAVWAFGKITLPHQLVRLILIEQIYRGFSILNNHPYHHQ